MNLDVYSFGPPLERVAALARAVEATGFGGIWFTEAAHNPYLPCALAAEATERITVGTGIALAFTRSPMVTAQIAWDLAAASRGRFVLGLGTQVKAHVERRFGVPYSHPGPRLREYVLAVRACLAAFEGDAPLDFHGDFYTLDLLPPFFAPGPLPPPARVPIYIAGVNRGLAAVAGETCDGLHVHPLHSPEYLRQVIVPAVEKGAARAGRPASSTVLAVPVFVVVDEGDEAVTRQRADVRRQISFYGSTRTYRAVFETHGWHDVPARLHELQAARRTNDMAAVITDEMVDAFSLTAAWDQLAERIVERYAGLPVRVFPYSLPTGWEDDGEVRERWTVVASALAGARW